MDLDTLHAHNINEATGELFLLEPQPTDDSAGEGITPITSAQFLRNFLYLDGLDSRSKIILHMNTPGGDWVHGMAIHDAIRNSNKHVVAINYGEARSMSSVIFLAADTRIMTPNSKFMLHAGAEAVAGTVKQVLTAAKQTKHNQTVMLEVYLSAMRHAPVFKGLSKSTRKKWLVGRMDAEEEVYFTAPEAVKYGFADHILGNNGWDWGRIFDEDIIW